MAKIFNCRRFRQKSSWLSYSFVVLDAFCAFLTYYQSVQTKGRLLAQLEENKTALLSAIEEAEERQQGLKLQIASQKDPAYIELLLMRELGLVPEGQTKVFFEKS